MLQTRRGCHPHVYGGLQIALFPYHIEYNYPPGSIRATLAPAGNRTHYETEADMLRSLQRLQKQGCIINKIDGPGYTPQKSELIDTNVAANAALGVFKAIGVALLVIILRPIKAASMMNKRR